jgi:hypothetical protein
VEITALPKIRFNASNKNRQNSAESGGLILAAVTEPLFQRLRGTGTLAQDYFCKKPNWILDRPVAFKTATCALVNEWSDTLLKPFT